MSTRAIITVKSADGKDVKRLYAHGDGYPPTVGMLVYNFATKIAPTLDINSPNSRVRKAAWGDDKKGTEGRYHKFSGLGQAYATMANVTVEPDKFIPALITFMTTKGYGGLYLTDRDPDKEAAERQNGHGGTDIKWHYVVTLGKDYGGKPTVDAYTAEAYGPKVPGWINSATGKPTMIGSREHFVKRGPSIPALAEKEERDRKRMQKKYEKEDRERKAKEEAAKKGTVVQEMSIYESQKAAEARVKKIRSSRGQLGTRVYTKGLKGLK